MQKDPVLCFCVMQDYVLPYKNMRFTRVNSILKLF